jgi:hypothetical protein
MKTVPDLSLSQSVCTGTQSNPHYGLSLVSRFDHSVPWSSTISLQSGMGWVLLFLVKAISSLFHSQHLLPRDRQIHSQLLFHSTDSFTYTSRLLPQDRRIHSLSLLTSTRSTSHCCFCLLPQDMPVHNYFHSCLIPYASLPLLTVPPRRYTPNLLSSLHPLRKTRPFLDNASWIHSSGSRSHTHLTDPPWQTKVTLVLRLSVPQYSLWCTSPLHRHSDEH